jgi:hypothetical protein
VVDVADELLHRRKRLRLGRIYADLAVRMLGAAPAPVADETRDVPLEAHTDTQTDLDDDTHDRAQPALAQDATRTDSTEAQQDAAEDEEDAE